jgi:hypothetical protein
MLHKENDEKISPVPALMSDAKIQLTDFVNIPGVQNLHQHLYEFLIAFQYQS